MGKSKDSGNELWRCWLRTARRRPRAVLLVDASTGRSFNAAEITAAAETIARGLPGKNRGGCIAWTLANGLDWLAIFLATQKTGWAALPLDADFTAPQARALAAQLGATHAWDGKNLQGLRARAHRWRGTAVAKVTSGSTGQPAAIRCQARHLLADYHHIRRGMGLRPRDKNLGLIPFGHSYGLGNLVLPLLVDGLPIVTAGAYTIAQIGEWCEHHRPTVFPSVPAVFQLLAESPGKNRLAHLRLAISAGAPLPASTAQAFYRRFGLRLHNFYGASETGGLCYDCTGVASLSGRSVGKPLPGVRIKLSAGRVRAQSRAVATPAGRQTLPDCGEWNKQGELVLTGRIAPLANLGGRKVAPAEIEAQVRALPGVTDAWCTVGQRAGRDFLAAAAETTSTATQLARVLALRLPPWKIPRVWAVLPRFPRNTRGKTDTRALVRHLGL